MDRRRFLSATGGGIGFGNVLGTTGLVQRIGLDEDDLERLHPESDITVQPDAEVIFEVAADDEITFLEWEVDGEYVDDSIGPWQGWDYGYGNANYLRHTFESEGS